MPLTATDVARGTLTGRSGEPGPLLPGSDDPLAALQAVILPELQRDPCLVMFSGGRDSSAVLAVATALARREGLPEPIPVTHTYPDPNFTDAQESRWQELVIAHLGSPEWVRIPVVGDHDVIGPLAAAGLRKHGLLYPALVHDAADFFQLGSGGVVLTGQGGDEVLGRTRSTPIAHLRYRRGASNLVIAGAAAQAVAPAALRRRLHARLVREFLADWLRPVARQELLHDMVHDAVSTPLSYSDAIRRLPYARMVNQGLRACDIVAGSFETELRHPLLASSFLDALARRRGRLGYPNRTAAMTDVFGSLLPTEILARSSKAHFTSSAIAQHSRDFAKSWDGSGFDDDLVNPEALRAQWLSELPNPGSFLPLQAAWLAGQSLK